MPDYQKNPLFTSEINKIQSHEPNISFGYSWDGISGKWVPTPKDINVVATVDMTSTDAILEGISGELSNIHVDVALDSDTRAHELLESISGSLTGVAEVGDTATHELLSGISGQLSGIHVDVEIDKDERTHELLESISGFLGGVGEVNDKTSHELLESISGYLGGVGKVNDQISHSLLSGISGQLNDIHVDVEIDSDTRSHELLESISGFLGAVGKVDDETTHHLLEGISGQLDSIHVDVEIDSDTRSHELLESISGFLGEVGKVDDETTHELLEKISQDLQEIHVDVAIDSDTRSHELLESISGYAKVFDKIDDGTTHEILSGIRGDLQNTEAGYINILEEISSKLDSVEQAALQDHDIKTHNLIESFSEQNTQDLQVINESLQNITVDIRGNDLSDTKTHELLSGISGHSDCHYKQNHRMLGAIKDNAENLSLSVEELKKDFRETTYHKKVYEKHVLMPEESPEPSQTEPLSFEEKIFKLRKDRQNNEFLFMKESYDGVQLERIEDMEESMPFAIYGEKYIGDDSDWHSFFPLAKRMGNSDRVNLFNNDIYPLEIKFQGGDSTWIDPGYKVEMSKEEASQLFIRNQFAISKFEIEYSLQRLYTPEEEFTRNDEHPYTAGHQSYGRIGLTSVAISESFLYVKYLNKWKRVAIASWEDIDVRTQHAFPISYFNAYSTENYLYLDANDGERRVLIADWEITDKIPLDSHNKIWADSNYIYAKLPSRLDSLCDDRLGHSSWKRYPLTIYNKS